jgi:hypothetical protein
MWTEENRARYDRSQLRYPSDMTDEEWKHVAALIPPAKTLARGRAARIAGRRAPEAGGGGHFLATATVFAPRKATGSPTINARS